VLCQLQVRGPDDLLELFGRQLYSPLHTTLMELFDMMSKHPAPVTIHICPPALVTTSDATCSCRDSPLLPTVNLRTHRQMEASHHIFPCLDPHQGDTAVPSPPATSRLTMMSCSGNSREEPLCVAHCHMGQGTDVTSSDGSRKWAVGGKPPPVDPGVHGPCTLRMDQLSSCKWL
jgi:hypothetical protein